MCKWEGNSMESEPSPQSFGTESGAATAKGKLLSRFHDIFGTAMMAQAEIHVQFSDKLVRSWQMAWNPWICRPQRAWVRLRTWRIVKQSEQIWAVWGSKIRFRKVKRFWNILDFFTLPLWCSPVFLRDLKEQEIADPWFRRQYNSKCGQCGHVPGGSLDETTHQKNYDNSLQVKISLWKTCEMMDVFPCFSFVQLAGDLLACSRLLPRQQKTLFVLGLHGFHWICLTRTLWLRFSFWTVEETEEPEVSAETAGLYFKRLEYFNFGSVLHNVLIFNISRTSGAPVRWLFSPGLMIFRFPRELTRGDLVKCLKVGQCSDSVELLTSTSSTSSTSTYISQMFHTYISHLFFLGSLLTNLEEVSRWICWFLHFCTWFTFPPGGTACGTPGCQPL